VARGAHPRQKRRQQRGHAATALADATVAGPRLRQALRRDLARWFADVRDARRMPWRRTRDPYAIWLSEIMLQQTRVESVIPYYERFLAAFPTVEALAEARQAEVLALWSGLGYYRRARMLHAAAVQVVAEHGGRFPSETEGLRRLRGVGAYTAGAVASIAFGRPAPVVDGNVTRVLSRLFAMRDDVRRAAGQARILAIAEELVQVPEGDPGDWNQALMELGATVCVPGAPRCDLCPVRAHCAGRADGTADELPVVSPKRKPVDVARVAVVLTSPSAVLLARRRPEALFGGLWEPPGAEGAIAPLAKRLGIDATKLSGAGQVVHTLSHRRLVVDVLRGELGARKRWALPGPDYDAIEVTSFERLATLGQASFARKVLDVASAVGTAVRSR
jgi:A/G-specific adenine glycosylase